MKWLVGLMSAVIIFFSNFFGNQIPASPPTVAAPSQTQVASTSSTIAGEWKLISDGSRSISLEDPPGWIVVSGNPIYIYPTVDDENSVVGTWMSVQATLGPYVVDVNHQLSGTDSGFATERNETGESIVNGSIEQTVIKNVTIYGIPAVEVRFQTAPGVNSEPFLSDVMWIHSGALNWYINISDLDPEMYTSAFNKILSTIQIACEKPTFFLLTGRGPYAAYTKDNDAVVLDLGADNQEFPGLSYSLANNPPWLKLEDNESITATDPIVGHYTVILNALNSCGASTTVPLDVSVASGTRPTEGPYGP
jgi:hypothetical protein